jgi:hypothetical protein
MEKNLSNADYETAHNRAVRQYKKMSMFILWSGVLNLVAAIMTVIRGTEADFALAYTFNAIIYRVLIEQSSMTTFLLGLLIISIGALSAIIFAAIGFFATLGKRLFLFLGTGLYILDFIALFIFAPAGDSNLAMLFMHAMISIALGVAIFSYYKVIDIEKKFKKV